MPPDNSDSAPLTKSQQNTFRSEGVLHLPDFIPRPRLKAVKDSILAELMRLRIWSGSKSLGSALDRLPAFQQIARLSSQVKVPNLHDALCTPEVQAAVAALAGAQPVTAQGEQLLLSLPRQGTWSLAQLNWHVDVAPKPDPDEVPGIQAFYVIDDVVPQGGATLALARSHRLAPQVNGALRNALKSSGTDLAPALAASGTALAEMSGKAGDVFLMDMRTLHSPSVNASKHIRMMATTRYRISR
ncbi:phytanoyl-CoA dioxygenase family protein [Acidovorax sp.]|uniref:phytanoyl-CoA dioxygenase family protein n=1 Tax=Acidovorax sp. TaxID=1872122 RepID=UPI002ACE0D5A|nr:phytanoyl-CoA dioxygenase family protein [Acidovorax sp.]MDZ7864292.1 phytanoyl-CoA dioxygenase family protein [Acidovorax sp.]